MLFTRFGKILVKYKEQKNLAVICNDAGGAEIISSWLKRKKKFFVGVLSGPAKDIFKKKKLKYKKSNLNNAVKNSSWVLTGSGWSSKLEINGIKQAKRRKKYVVTFLDHWFDYRSRFKSGNRYIYPNEVWVGDREAEKIAKKILKKIKIKYIKNPLWEDFRREKKIPLKGKKIKRFLVATSNLDAKIFSKRKTKLTDFKMIFKTINFIKIKFENDYKHLSQISIKRHPSEKLNKYFKFINKSGLKGLKIEESKNILNTLKKYSVLIGCETSLLALAKILGLKTYNVHLENFKSRKVPKKYFDNYLNI